VFLRSATPTPGPTEERNSLLESDKVFVADLIHVCWSKPS
jgi:hypothetical protein